MKPILSIILLIISIPSISQSGGLFPPEPFNGMQVNYNITGATISKFYDTPGFTWSRSLVMTGVDKAGTLGISGTLQGGGLSCTVIVIVTIDNQSERDTLEVYPDKPKKFNVFVKIPTNTKSADIYIHMHGHYSMGGGSRYVVVQGGWDIKNGPKYFENDPNSDPDKGKPKPSRVPLLMDFIKTFYKNNDDIKVLSGMKGTDINKLATFDKEKYNPYICGTYQGNILNILDSIRFGKQPKYTKYRDLIKDYDYGPIQNWPVNGVHHAVVIYPKGGNWKEDGIVLDPWIEQEKRTYTMEEWRKYNWAPNPSSFPEYKDKYPITGGKGYSDNSASEKLKSDVGAWIKTLPKSEQDKFNNMGGTAEERYKARLDAYNKSSSKNTKQSVTSDCPLELYIIDNKDKVSGLLNGEIRSEIPGVFINCMMLEDGTYWTEIKYPSRENIKIKMKGIGSGEANIYSAFNIKDEYSKPTVYKYTTIVNNKEEFTLDPTLDNLPIYSTNPINKNKTTFNGKLITIDDILNNSTIRTGKTPETNDDKNSNNSAELSILENINEFISRNNPIVPIQIKLVKSAKITKIQNFHTNVANTTLLKIKLLSAKGQIFGPWTAKKISFEGFEQYECWQVDPNIALPPGVYTIIDSDPGTWVTNPEASNRGFTRVLGINK